MSTPVKYLEFKFLKNVMIDLGDMQHYVIPMTMQYVPNPAHVPRTGKMIHAPKGIVSSNDELSSILIPVFDLDYTQKILFQDELPTLPKRMSGSSDAFYEKQCDLAFEKAARAKIFNDVIRKKVASYVANGTIEVTSDPFENIVEIEGLAELAAAIAEADAAA